MSVRSSRTGTERTLTDSETATFPRTMAAHHATRSATAALRADRAMVADQVLDPDEDTEHAHS